jgi:hypothetical protein
LDVDEAGLSGEALDFDAEFRGETGEEGERLKFSLRD